MWRIKSPVMENHYRNAMLPMIYDFTHGNSRTLNQKVIGMIGTVHSNFRSTSKYLISKVPNDLITYTIPAMI